MINNSKAWGRNRKWSVADTTILVWRTRDKQYLKLCSSPLLSTGCKVCCYCKEFSEAVGASDQTPTDCEHICTRSNHIFFLWISAAASRAGKRDHFWQIVLKAQCLLFSVLFTSCHLSGNASKRKQVQSKIDGLIIFTELLTKMWLQVLCFLDHSWWGREN